MAFTPHQKTILLTIISQIPMVLLLIIFFRIPNLPLQFRIAALVTVGIEATLMSELIGNIVQKVRSNEEGIIVRGVFERKKLLWADVKKAKQVIISPMGFTNIKNPSKLILIKAHVAPGLRCATDWWEKKGSLAHKRSGVGDLVKKYDQYVKKELEGWFILWSIDYRRPQEHVNQVEVEYLALDGREKNVIDELKHFGKVHIKTVEIYDNTYPTFVKNHGGIYAKETDFVWESIR